ncbi:hypothetical protein AAMO2058_000165100 [Amorphochlora amoebiformis]
MDSKSTSTTAATTAANLRPESPVSNDENDVTVVADTVTEQTKVVGREGVDGGELLEWMDITACMSAEKFSGMPSVTAAMDNVVMQYNPVFGEAVIVKTQVNRAFTTSMEVGCKLWAENLKSGKKQVICRAYFTFVSKGPNKKKCPLPKLTPGTRAENVRRYTQAKERRNIRLSRNKIVKETCGIFLKRSQSITALDDYAPKIMAEMKSDIKGDDEDDKQFISPPRERTTKPPAESRTETTEMVLPQHANHMGNCFGGVAMGWMAACAFTAAYRFAREDMRLASIDQISFKNPVLVGDRFKVIAQVNNCFHDYVEVGVRATTQTLGAKSPIGFILTPETPDDLRRYREALGRERVRLKRSQVGSEVQTAVLAAKYTETSKLGLIYQNITGLLRVYNRKYMTKGWTVHYHDPDNQIEIATQKGNDGVMCFRAASKMIEDPHKVFKILYDFEKYRSKWDGVFKAGKVMKTIDRNNDIVHLVMGVGPKPNDFCLLRSWRHDTEGVWLISTRSINHPDIPPVEEYKRAFVLSSGYILRTRRMNRTAKIKFEAKSMGLTLKGLRVFSVDGQSKSLGVKVGWEIKELNGEEIIDQAALQRVLVRVKKKGKPFEVLFGGVRNSTLFRLSGSDRKRRHASTTRPKGDKLVLETKSKGRKELCELTYIVQFQDKAVELVMGDMVGYNRRIVRSFIKLKALTAKMASSGDVA